MVDPPPLLTPVSLPLQKLKTTFDTYDPNCKILCTLEGVCKKLIGAEYAEYAKVMPGF